MDQLQRVIGSAPSEIEHVALMEVLRSERNRVRDSLLAFKMNPQPKGGRKATPKSRGGTLKQAEEDLKKLREAGITLDDVKKLLNAKGAR